MSLITKKAVRSATQAAITTSGLTLLNNFTCNGTLTSVVLGVDVRKESPTRNLYPEIALWRREPENTGALPYSKVQGSSRTVTLTPADFSTSGVFEYTLYPPLNFRAFDTLGWQQPALSQSVVRMYSVDAPSFLGSSEGNNFFLPLLYPVAGELQVRCFSYLVFIIL